MFPILLGRVNWPCSHSMTREVLYTVHGFTGACASWPSTFVTLVFVISCRHVLLGGNLKPSPEHAIQVSCVLCEAGEWGTTGRDSNQV